MKKAISNVVLFDEIVKKLKEKGNYPSILDYSLGASLSSDRFEIRTDDFWPELSLMYGGSEGIYLEFYISGYLDKQTAADDGINYRMKLGTFKTLQEDDEALRSMAMLYADCMIALREYKHENRDAFDFTTHVEMFAKDGTRRPGTLRCEQEVDAEDEAKKRLSKDDTLSAALLRNMETGEERLIVNG